MPFDPALPQQGTEIDAVQMRAQLNGLKELIDAVPAGPGPAGPAGPQGPVFASVSIGTVTTGAPGTPAAADVSTTGNDVSLSFTIPAGEPGEVTQAALDAAILGTAQNPASIAPLSITISDPPTKAEVEAILSTLNTLIGLLQRPP